MKVPGILWQMRLKSSESLAHYLQEAAALNVLIDLSPQSKEFITAASMSLPGFLTYDKIPHDRTTPSP